MQVLNNSAPSLTSPITSIDARKAEDEFLFFVERALKAAAALNPDTVAAMANARAHIRIRSTMAGAKAFYWHSERGELDADAVSRLVVEQAAVVAYDRTARIAAEADQFSREANAASAV